MFPTEFHRELIQRIHNGGVPALTVRSLDRALIERRRQDEKWGTIENFDERPLERWLAILSEEHGELAEEIVEFGYDGDTKHYDNMRAEAVQVAAVALAMVESIDRRRADGR